MIYWARLPYSFNIGRSGLPRHVGTFCEYSDLYKSKHLKTQFSTFRLMKMTQLLFKKLQNFVFEPRMAGDNIICQVWYFQIKVDW